MTETFDEFKKRWLNKAEEIKKQKFDGGFCIAILNDFLTETLYFSSQNPLKERGFVYEREKLKNDVNHAIMIANSNYQQYIREKSWWYRFFSGDKEINLFKYK